MSALRRLLPAILLLATAPLRAAEPSTGAVAGVPIGDIRIERLNVFDPAVPGENWWPFMTANRIHIPTRESVIRRELLFAPGDPWDPLRIIQSERNLRANGSFRRADIVPVTRPDGKVDAVVRAQDSWTTNPRVAAGTEGGESFFSFGLEEGNVLGYGKSVFAEQSSAGARRSTAFGYGDPRFMGTRLALSGRYARGDTGDSAGVRLTRPFYALDSPRAEAVSWERSLGDGSVFRDGAEYSKYRQRRRVADASAGALLSGDRALVQRGEAGWHSERYQYEATGETIAGTLPADREMSGPTLGYSLVSPNYVKETFINQMERVEDFNLGNEFSVRAGWMGRATGSDQDRFVYRASEQQGLSIAPGRFLIAQMGLGGRVAGGKAQNALATVGLSAFWKTFWRGDHTFVAHFEGSRGRSLDRDSQIVLGGSTGLRGYKNNSFVGGKAVLVNFEDRFFFEGEWFHLARFGAAVFVDSGAVAPEREGLGWNSVKTDVGVGLRVASTRSRGGGVARIDLAYALNPGPGGSRLVVSIRAGQAFSVFNSAAQRVDPAPSSRLN